jgi:hypothetical protein
VVKRVEGAAAGVTDPGPGVGCRRRSRGHFRPAVTARQVAERVVVVVVVVADAAADACNLQRAIDGREDGEDEERGGGARREKREDWQGCVERGAWSMW